jgi:NAD(P)-dependent dehydrogenase (short-subunit alcohol dehydrogenase family)
MGILNDHDPTETHEWVDSLSAVIGHVGSERARSLTPIRKWRGPASPRSSARRSPVDILINNAGITRDMTFKKMTKADWDVVIHTNLDSAFNMAKQVCDGMVERGWGRIVNVSSVNGSKGAFGQTNYAAAKAGMHGFTKSLALEVARKSVTVNTISPGYIGTNGDGASERGARFQDSAADSPRKIGQARGDRGPHHLPLFGRSGVRDRREYRDQWWATYAVTQLSMTTLGD